MTKQSWNDFAVSCLNDEKGISLKSLQILENMSEYNAHVRKLLKNVDGSTFEPAQDASNSYPDRFFLKKEKAAK